MKISAYFKKIKGEYITTIRKEDRKQNGTVVIKEKQVPTHPSQIRRERETCLWKPEEKEITPFSLSLDPALL